MDSASSRNFLHSTVQLAASLQVIGIDVVWLYPAESAASAAALVTLLSDLRIALASIQSKVLNVSKLNFKPYVDFATDHPHPVTLSVSALGDVKGIAPHVYPIAAISNAVDFVHLHTFRLDPISIQEAQPAGIVRGSFYSRSAVLASVDTWLEAALSSTKLVLGVALFGREWVMEG